MTASASSFGVPLLENPFSFGVGGASSDLFSLPPFVSAPRQLDGAPEGARLEVPDDAGTLAGFPMTSLPVDSSAANPDLDADFQLLEGLLPFVKEGEQDEPVNL